MTAEAGETIGVVEEMFRVEPRYFLTRHGAQRLGPPGEVPLGVPPTEEQLETLRGLPGSLRKYVKREPAPETPLRPNWARRIADHIETTGKQRREQGERLHGVSVASQLRSRLAIQAGSIIIHNPDDADNIRKKIEAMFRFQVDGGFIDKNATGDNGSGAEYMGDAEVFSRVVVDLINAGIDAQDIASFFDSVRGVASMDPHLLKYFLHPRGKMEGVMAGAGMGLVFAYNEEKKSRDRTELRDIDLNGWSDGDLMSVGASVVSRHNRTAELPYTLAEVREHRRMFARATRQFQMRSAQTAMDNINQFSRRVADLLEGELILTDGSSERKGIATVARSAREASNYLELMRLEDYHEVQLERPVSTERARIPIAGALVDAVTIHADKPDAELADLLINSLRRRKVSLKAYKQLLCGFVTGDLDEALLVEIRDIVTSHGKRVIFDALHRYTGDDSPMSFLEGHGEDLLDRFLEDKEADANDQEKVLRLGAERNELYDELVTDLIDGVPLVDYSDNGLAVLSALMPPDVDASSALSRIRTGIIPEVIAQLRERKLEHPEDPWTQADYEMLGISERWDQHTDRVDVLENVKVPGPEAVEPDSVVLEFSIQAGPVHAAHLQIIRGALRFTVEDLILAGIVEPDYEGEIVVAVRVNSGNPNKADDVDVDIRQEMVEFLLRDTVVGDKGLNKLIMYPAGESSDLTAAERMQYNYDRYLEMGRKPHKHVRVMGAGKLPYEAVDQKLVNNPHILTIRADQMAYIDFFPTMALIWNTFDKANAMAVAWPLCDIRSTQIRQSLQAGAISPEMLYVSTHPAVVKNLFGPGKEQWAGNVASWEEYLQLNTDMQRIHIFEFQDTQV